MYDYFRCESNYTIVAVCIENPEYKKSFKGHRVYDFAEIEKQFPPITHEMFIAVGYRQLNHLRQRLYVEARKKGYRLASFISPYAYVGRDVNIGDNCVIMEDNNIQYGVDIGSNTFIWSSNHIGHHSKIGRHCFLASGITISGSNDVGDFTFIGSGSTTGDSVTFGQNCLVAAGTTITKDVPEGQLVKSKTSSETTPLSNLSVQAKEMWGW